MLDAQHRSRARHMVEHVLSLREAEEALHYHASGSWVPLDHASKVSHLRAKAASHLADHVAKNWPAKQRRLLHAKASNEHGRTAHHLHGAGFHHLSAQHSQWADYHAAQANQTEDAKPELVRHATTGGHARSGHTLPKQPSSTWGDVPTSAVSHQRAKETDARWNERAGGYQNIPKAVRKIARRAHEVGRSVNRLSYDPNFSDEEKGHHHRAAATNHIQAGEELKRHGFEAQSDEHMKLAQKHTKRASEHDAGQLRRVK